MNYFYVYIVAGVVLAIVALFTVKSKLSLSASALRFYLLSILWVGTVIATAPYLVNIISESFLLIVILVAAASAGVYVLNRFFPVDNADYNDLPATLPDDKDDNYYPFITDALFEKIVNRETALEKNTENKETFQKDMDLDKDEDEDEGEPPEEKIGDVVIEDLKEEEEEEEEKKEKEELVEIESEKDTEKDKTEEESAPEAVKESDVKTKKDSIEKVEEKENKAIDEEWIEPQNFEERPFTVGEKSEVDDTFTEPVVDQKENEKEVLTEKEDHGRDKSPESKDLTDKKKLEDIRNRIKSKAKKRTKEPLAKEATIKEEESLENVSVEKPEEISLKDKSVEELIDLSINAANSNDSNNAIKYFEEALKRSDDTEEKTVIISHLINQYKNLGYYKKAKELLLNFVDSDSKDLSDDLIQHFSSMAEYLDSIDKSLEKAGRGGLPFSRVPKVIKTMAEKKLKKK